MAEQSTAERSRLVPIDAGQKKSLRDHVHVALRMAIISGQFAEDQRLNERTLATELGVSTTPLKEAFRQLEAEGLIETLPRRGVRVRFGKAWAEEMILARAALESIIASVAAARINTQQGQELKALVRLMAAATLSGNIDELIVLNSQFHDGIHRASGCRHLTRLIERQQFYDDSARRIIHRDIRERGVALKEHRGIAAAIIAKNEQRAEQLMRGHVLRSGEHYIATVFTAEDKGTMPT